VFARLPERVGLILTVVALGLAPAAFTSVAHAAAPTALRVGLTQDIDSLNPFLAETAASTDIGRVMYEFLTTYDPRDEHPVPALATKWTHSADGRTWTYTIRTGATWSDGQPITAGRGVHVQPDDDQQGRGHRERQLRRELREGHRAERHDVVIDTKAPQATMLALDVPIVPQHVWAGVSDIGKYTNLPTPVTRSWQRVVRADRLPGGPVRQTIREQDVLAGAPKVDELDFVHFGGTDARCRP